MTQPAFQYHASMHHEDDEDPDLPPQQRLSTLAHSPSSSHSVVATPQSSAGSLLDSAPSSSQTQLPLQHHSPSLHSTEHGSLHHPDHVSHPSRLSDELHLQTDLASSAPRSGSFTSPPSSSLSSSNIGASTTSVSNIYTPKRHSSQRIASAGGTLSQRASMTAWEVASGALPMRSSSVKSLGASHAHAGSLSPASMASAATSPGMGPLMDITPLPSPMSSQRTSWAIMPPPPIGGHAGLITSPQSASSYIISPQSASSLGPNNSTSSLGPTASGSGSASTSPTLPTYMPRSSASQKRKTYLGMMLPVVEHEAASHSSQTNASSISESPPSSATHASFAASGLGIAHSRHRSHSEYVPSSLHQSSVPPPSHAQSQAPSSKAEAKAPPASTHHESQTSVRDPRLETQQVPKPMQREEYLAVQRGISARLPTPPHSRTSASSDNESPPPAHLPISPPVGATRSDADCASTTPVYEAHLLSSGALRRWMAVRPLGQGTFSTVMLATSDAVYIRRRGAASSSLKGSSQPAAENGIAGSGSHSHQPRSIEDTPPSRSLVAVKICEHGPAGGADERKIEASLHRELEILKAIRHPSLIRLRAVSLQPKRAYLVLTYCPGGDLFDLASRELHALVPGLVRRMFAELVDAVRYLHGRLIVHRDIKLENVLVNLHPAILAQTASTTDWSRHPTAVVTLTDLGLGRAIPAPPASPTLTTRCGSEDYAAPELLLGQGYDGRQTDAWALGVLLYALIEGRLPFDPVPGKGGRRPSPTTHRIARCEWGWHRLGDADGDWDPEAAGASDYTGAREIVEGLLQRVRSRWSLDRVAATDWVAQAIQVPGGVRFRDEDGENATQDDADTEIDAELDETSHDKLNRIKSDEDATMAATQGVSALDMDTDAPLNSNTSQPKARVLDNAAPSAAQPPALSTSLSMSDDVVMVSP